VNCVWRVEGGTRELYCDGHVVGAIHAFEHDVVSAEDVVVQVAEGVFRWSRVFTAARGATGPVRLTMDFVAAHKPEYMMIPAVSYNGNAWGSGKEPKGFVDRGQPWTFAYHRTAVPAATYSEGKSWSVALFASAFGAPCSCCLIPDDDCVTHRLIWPEEETPRVYSGRDSYAEPYKSELRLEPAQSLEAVAYIVTNPISSAGPRWGKFLDVAWQQNYHEVGPRFPPDDIWRLGVKFAKESLWAEEGGFRGFSIGLVWDGTGWRQREHRKYEIGWAGQNGSLANSLLHDYLRTGDRSSRDRGLATMDSWVSARLKNGLIHCLFDYVLGQRGGEEWVDACNLGDAASEFFEACDLASKCGAPRPEYRDVALGICDFVVRNQREDGRLGKAWLTDGTCVDPDGTIGCFLIPPLIQAHRLAGEIRYLDAAEQAYQFYMYDLLRNGYTTAGALDTHCIDKESATPLLDAGLSLYEITDNHTYLEWAEYAAYYLSTWQWHHTVTYPEGSALHALGYDTFGGTSVSTQHHHQDPFAIAFVPGLLRLAELTHREIWRQRALAAWANGSIGISDGSLVMMGRKRPAGSQDEGFFHTRWLDFGNVSDWLVSWPTAFRLATLRRLRDWSVLR
jgi:hypothetical protein